MPLSPSPLRHASLEFDSNDVKALINAIDSSPDAQSPAQQLRIPVELLLHVLKHVPIDYILDWRAVCSGFRDAIDGYILYHYLQRTELIGLSDPQNAMPGHPLDHGHLDLTHSLRACFQDMESALSGDDLSQEAGPIWNKAHAIFRINADWYNAFQRSEGLSSRQGDTVDDANDGWKTTLQKLELRRPEAWFGFLRWCIKLDHAVLDLDFPLEMDRKRFQIEVDLQNGTIRVAWKAMLFNFIKTETQLRRLMNETKTAAYTFSHAEDCLRAVRQKRLQSSLNTELRADRQIQQSLRLFRPLFGKPYTAKPPTLALVEDAATQKLLILRREAAMTERQGADLRQLKIDYDAVKDDVLNMEKELMKFKSHLLPLRDRLFIPSAMAVEMGLPQNPEPVSDERRNSVQESVCEWRKNRSAIRQIYAQFRALNQALAKLEDRSQL